MFQEDKGDTLSLSILGTWEGDLIAKPAARKKRLFHLQMQTKNSCHDSGMWPGSRMLKYQNIKAASVWWPE